MVHSVVLSAIAGKFLAGAVIGAAIEVIDQKLVQKKESIDGKAVAYEAAVGGVGAVVGGVEAVVGGVGQSVAKHSAKKAAAKVTAKTAAKTVALEAAGGFATDVGKQVFVDSKDLEEVDYGQAIKTAAVAGAAGAVGYVGEHVMKKVIIKSPFGYRQTMASVVHCTENSQRKRGTQIAGFGN